MAVVFMLCISLLASPLAATTVQRFDLASLTANAERIVVGVCNRADPQFFVVADRARSDPGLGGQIANLHRDIPWTVRSICEFKAIYLT